MGKVWTDKNGKKINGRFLCRDCSDIQCYDCLKRENEELQKQLAEWDKQDEASQEHE